MELYRVIRDEGSWFCEFVYSVNMYSPYDMLCISTSKLQYDT